MSARSGKVGRVLLGTYVVANIKSFDMSGLINEVIIHSALEKDFVGKHYGTGNFGTVEIVGNYDPDDTTGQDILMSACTNKNKLTTLYFGIDVSGTSQWVPDLTNDSSSSALVTKCANIGIDEGADMMTIGFTIELEGQWVLE